MIPATPTPRRRALKEVRELAHLGLPIVATQLAQAAMGMADTLMAGRYSADDLAGVAIGSSLWVPLLLLFTGILMATIPLVSQAFGADERHQINTTLQQGSWLALLLGLLGAWALAHAPPLYRWLEVDAAMLRVGSGYIQALAWGMPAAALYTLLRCGQEALHQTRTIMLISIAGLLVNIPLNYLLIYGYLGLPEMGGVGCGWATTIALWAQLVLATLLTVRSPHFAQIRFWRHWQAPRLREQAELLRIGIPIGVAIFIEASMFLLIALLLTPLGSVVVSGHQIAFSVISVTFMIPLSLSMAISIRVGFTLGRRDPRGARRVATTGLALGGAIALITGSLMLLLARTIAGGYSNEPEVVELATALLILAAIFQLSDVIQVCAAGALRGYKDTRFPLYGAFIAYWLIGLPVGYSLAMTPLWGAPMGAQGFWIGFISGLTVAATALTIRLHRTSRQRVLAGNTARQLH